MKLAMDYVNRTWGIVPLFDLPEPSKGSDPVGVFKVSDRSIHLWEGAEPHTLFHEVGHFLDHRSFRRVRRALWAVLGAKVALDIFVILSGHALLLYNIGSLAFIGSIFAWFGVWSWKQEDRAERIAQLEWRRFQTKKEYHPWR